MTIPCRTAIRGNSTSLPLSIGGNIGEAICIAHVPTDTNEEPAVNRNDMRLLATLVATGAVALMACSHTPMGNSADGGTEGDGDRWVVRGSATVGGTIGNPQGPYSPR